MREENNIYSEKVQAGSRTYFGDLKKTRNGLLYMVLTEKRKQFDQDGNATQTKNRVVFFSEDIKRVVQMVNSLYAEMKERMPDYDFDQFDHKEVSREERKTG